MDPELYKAAKEGDVMYLAARIHGRNITEEEAMRIQDGIFLKRTQHGNNNILHIAARAGRDTFVVEALRRFPFLSDLVAGAFWGFRCILSDLVNSQSVFVAQALRRFPFLSDQVNSQGDFVAEALRRFPFLSDQVNSQGDTPLLVAARFGHLQVVKTLAETNNELPMQDDHTATAVKSGTNSRRSRRQRDVEEGLVNHQLEQATSSENGTNSRDMTTALENETNSSSSHRPRDVEEGLDDHHQLEEGTMQDSMATAVENGTNARDRTTALDSGE
ncbi:hypothetical protein RHMOL_Rhmol04G0047300 [Rhododendron molle]|uniref:Uncharacterized protein n=1 Tax=Rhododendron molle TaxID=49168 RepID=A0ACC0NX96_RHOML|nr:hypothetical protein RHMOL_Rhmol04G0047300 [Rhododendron molle]